MTTNENNTDLEQLFVQARESEPLFCDPQFTEGVLSGLAATHAVPMPLELSSKRRGSWLMDIVTAGIGFAAVSYVVDLQQVYAFIINLVPESVVISPMTLIAAMVGMTTVSIASWWAIEQR